MVDVLTWTTRSAYVLALPIGGAIIALLETRGRLAAARVVCHSAAAGALVCATIACVPMLLSDDRECEPLSSIPEVFAVVAATAAALSAAVAGTFCLIAGIGRCSPAPTSRASP